MPRAAVPPSLMTVLKTMTREERATFLLRYAEIYGRVYPREYDAHGYSVPPKKKMFKKAAKEPPETIGEPVAAPAGSAALVAT